MINKKYKVLFFGTPWIAKECLEELFFHPNCEIVAVISQPDKQKNRKKQIIYNEVKQFALEHQLTILQPDNINNIINEIKTLNADILITCAYGQFISEEILKLFKYPPINVHASLLPKLRGGAPIHWAIINQYSTTGISLMHMVKQMDAGDILFQEEIYIENNETYSSLLIKLAILARKMLKKHFCNFFNVKQINTLKQDKNLVTFGFNIKKEEQYINFNKSCSEINALVRGLNNKPLARFIYLNKEYKVYETLMTNIKSIDKPGTIINISNKGIEIATKDFNIIINKIQAPNKNPLYIKEFINGCHEFIVGNIIK